MSDVQHLEWRLQGRSDYKLRPPQKEQSLLFKEHEMEKLHTNIIHWLPDFKYKCEEKLIEEEKENNKHMKWV